MYKKFAVLITVIILFNCVFMGINFADSQTNNDVIRENSEIIQLLLEEVNVLQKAIELKREIIKNIKQVNENNSKLSNQNEQLREILSELKIISDFINYKENQISEELKIRENIKELKEQTKILEMLLYELQAMNQILEVQTGSNIINCKEGEIFNLLFTGENLKGANEIIYTVTYNPNEVEAIDLYGITTDFDLSLGNINNTDIEVLELSEGVIKFSVYKNISIDRNWSGILNNVKFKAKKDGISKINIKIEKRSY